MRCNTFRLNTIVLATSALVAGCGGGGGGGSSATLSGGVTGYTVPFSTPTKIDEFNPLVTATYNQPIVETFAADLTNTGKDNLVVAGRMSVSGAAWKNSKLSLYGWSGNTFQNQTTQWFSGTDNEIIGTEPGNIQFADFNGDTFLDMYVAPGTDSEAVDAGPGVVYMNNAGGSFTRSDLNLGDTWSHGSTLADLNNDGKMDIITLDYGFDSSLSFGNGDGTFNIISTNDGSFGGSSVVAGDFLGNGTTTMILTDTGGSDTQMFSHTVNGDGTVTMNQLGTLPTPIFDTGTYLANWTSAGYTGPASHDVRSLAMDFNNDGSLDVIVISRPSNNGANYWAPGSEVQFLQNNGSGTFSDVTSTVRVGYDTSKSAAYNPRVIDLNGDGLQDILLSGTGSGHTQVLVQTTEGKFVASYEQVMTAFTAQAIAAEGSRVDGWDSSGVTVLRGPDGNLYLATLVNVVNTTADRALYLSKIESTGVTTTQATIATIQQLWPYLSDAQANTVLSQTSTTWFGGKLIDFNNMLKPYGNLNIALNGRTGKLTPLTGNITGVNLSGKLNNVTVVDDLRRHYTANLSSLSSNQKLGWWSDSVNANNKTAAGSANLVGEATTIGDYSVALDQHTQNFSVGINNFKISDKTMFGFQLTNAAFNPWLSFNGVWGKINSSSTVEGTFTHRSNGYVSKLGIMNTKTDFTPGLVTKVSDMVSMWAEAGYEGSKFSMYAGVLPTVLSGSVKMNIPYAVDYRGNIMHNQVSTDIADNAVGYARVNYNGKIKKGVTYNISGVATHTGYTQANASIKINF
jgi:hypothetical protein